jgi:cytochrome c
MKRLFFVSAAIAVGCCSAAYAGNAESGKKLFESPEFGGGTTGKSCASCHAGGKKMSADLFERDQHVLMGQKMGSVADIVNMCIEKPLGGKAIDPKSEEMADILAYMETLVQEKKE